MSSKASSKDKVFTVNELVQRIDDVHALGGKKTSAELLSEWKKAAEERFSADEAEDTTIPLSELTQYLDELNEFEYLSKEYTGDKMDQKERTIAAARRVGLTVPGQE